MKSNVLNLLFIDELRVIVALASGFSIIHIQSGEFQHVLTFQSGLFSRIIPSSRRSSSPLLCLLNDTGILLTRESMIYSFNI
jgi:hypothetical protein